MNKKLLKHIENYVKNEGYGPMYVKGANTMSNIVFRNLVVNHIYKDENDSEIEKTEWPEMWFDLYFCYRSYEYTKEEIMDHYHMTKEQFDAFVEKTDAYCVKYNPKTDYTEYIFTFAKNNYVDIKAVTTYTLPNYDELIEEDEKFSIDNDPFKNDIITIGKYKKVNYTVGECRKIIIGAMSKGRIGIRIGWPFGWDYFYTRYRLHRMTWPDISNLYNISTYRVNYLFEKTAREIKRKRKE